VSGVDGLLGHPTQLAKKKQTPQNKKKGDEELRSQRNQSSTKAKPRAPAARNMKEMMEGR
jgi:hypothetical protein